MLLPTAPAIFTVAQIAEDPIGANSRLGLYTNFVNLLDYAAIAVPAGFRAASRLPFGVTLIGPAFSDFDLAAIADRLHQALGEGVGLAIAPASEPPAARVERAPDQRITVAVAGAHLSGLPLNRELTGLDAILLETTKTAPSYRLVALKGTNPPKPGLVHAPGFAGPGIEVELWSLSERDFRPLRRRRPRADGHRQDHARKRRDRSRIFLRGVRAGGGRGHHRAWRLARLSRARSLTYSARLAGAFARRRQGICGACNSRLSTGHTRWIMP